MDGLAAAWRDAALVLALLSFAAPGTPRAEIPPVQDLDPSELINYPYDLDSGLGSFSVSGRSVHVYRIPFSYTLRGLAAHPWGLKLTLPVSLGFHDLKAVLEGDEGVRKSLRTLTFVPGVEFQLPTGRGWLLKPFAEVGFGKEFAAGGEWVLIYATGTRALLKWPRGRFIWSFGAGVQWNGMSGIDRKFADDYGRVEAGVDFRFPLNVRLAEFSLDSSVYLLGRRFVSDLVFERIGRQPIEIENQYEVGITFGTEPPMRLWGVKLPRIGLSHRFGGDLIAYRINFGFPF